MASKTLQVGALYPNGLTVNVYLASDWTTGTFPTYGVAPPGSSVTSAVVSSGQLALTGLTASTEYVAGAQVGGHWRYVHFDTSVPTTPASSADVAAVSGDLTTHAALKTGVHGIPSMSSGEVPVWNGSAWIATNVATQAELDTHAALTTTAHGGLLQLGSTSTTAARGDQLSDDIGTWRTMHEASVRTTAGSMLAATNVLGDTLGAGVDGAVGNSTVTFYFNPADYAVTGKTLKIRVAGFLAIADVAPACNFTFGMHAVASFAGATNIGATLGAATVQAGAITTPAANSVTAFAATQVDAPVAGVFAVTRVINTNAAANSAAQQYIAVQWRNV